MKNSMLIVALSLGTLGIFAQSNGEEAEGNMKQSGEVIVQATAQDDYEVIRTTELPEAVMEALTNDYPDVEVQAAYVNSKDEYKLEVVNTDGNTVELFIDAEGNWIET